MRIKLFGEITAERLALALQGAAAQHGEDFGGFYGANLYLVAYSKDGERMEIVDNKGREVMLQYAIPDGGILRPEKSAAAKQRAKDALAAADTEQEEQRKQNQLWREQAQAEQVVRKNKAEQEKQFLQDHEAIFSMLVNNFGSEFLDEVNKAIESVWAEKKPIYLQGANKGMPRPLPYIHAGLGKVWLQTGRQMKSIKSPLFVYDRITGTKPIWVYPEWKNYAVPAIYKVIEQFANKLPDSQA